MCIKLVNIGLKIIIINKCIHINKYKCVKIVNLSLNINEQNKVYTMLNLNNLNKCIKIVYINTKSNNHECIILTNWWRVRLIRRQNGALDCPLIGYKLINVCCPLWEVEIGLFKEFVCFVRYG